MNGSASRRPRVLHAVSHLALGGAERVALTIIDALHAECDFSVYAVRGLGDGEMGRTLRAELQAHNVPLATGPRVPMRFGGVISGALGFARALRRFQPDLVHLHTEIPESSFAALLALRPAHRAIPLVRTIHNAVFWHFWRGLGRWCDRRLAHGFTAGVSRAAVDAVLQLRAESGAAPFPQPPVVIYNGVPAPATASRARTPDGPLRVVFGGRWESQKGTDLLPAILAAAPPPPARRAHLTVYGSGAHAALLRSLAAHPPPGWTVELRPPAPHFRDELAGFDLALLPSRFEGLALVGIEACLAGVPIVASDAVGLAETLPPGYPWIARAGDAASFAAALRAAFAASEQWPIVAARARDFAAEKFSVAAMADGYRSLYRAARSTPAPASAATAARASVSP